MTAPARNRRDRRPLFRYMQVQAISDQEILRALEQASRDSAQAIRRLERLPGVGSAVRVAQIQATQRELALAQATLWSRVGDEVVAGQYRAAAAAVQVNSIYDEVLLRTVDPSLVNDYRASELARSQQGIAAVNDRMSTSKMELSARVYRNEALATGKIDDIINSGLARGLSARELANEVRQFILPSTPGGVSYAAMRLARTEINNAFHAAQIRTNKEKPWVTGMRWNLSGSHPRPDTCDEYAGEDHDNLGSGVFKKENVPSKPHPHCFCFLTPDTDSDEAFIRKYNQGQYDAYLDKTLGPPSPVSVGAKVLPMKPVLPRRLPESPQGSLLRRYDNGNGVVSETELTGGISGDTRLATLSDGSRIVIKDGFDLNSADNEYLASLVGDAVGARVPAVAQATKDTVLMEYVDGQLGLSVEINEAIPESVLNSLAGNRLGLMDTLIGNTDRHGGNWILKDGEPWGIDHGSVSWPGNYILSDFADAAGLSLDSLENAFTVADMGYVEAQLISLRPEFVRLDHLSWYDQMIANFEIVAKRASGTGNLIAP